MLLHLQALSSPCSDFPLLLLLSFQLRLNLPSLSLQAFQVLLVCVILKNLGFFNNLDLRIFSNSGAFRKHFLPLNQLLGHQLLFKLIFNLGQFLFGFGDQKILLRLVQLFLMPLLIHLLFLIDLMLGQGWCLFKLWLQIALVFRDTRGIQLFQESIVASRLAFHFFDRRKGLYSS